MEIREKKQGILFFIMAFGLTYLLGIPLYLAKKQGLDIGTFPIVFMHLPAAGTILAALFTRKGDKNLPKGFFLYYLVITAILIIIALLPFFVKGFQTGQIANFSLLGFSTLAWLSLILGRKKLGYYGLSRGRVKDILLVCLIFLLIYFLRSFLALYLEKGKIDWLLMFSTERLIYLLALIPNFFLGFLPFFGEEYGWRYFLQPILEKKFGMIKGVLLLGLIWGLWHLPLNLFYYSAEGMGAMSLVNQIGNCITLSIFMAYAYNKTRSVWAPTIIHYLNNNLILLFVEDWTKLDKILENQEYTWSSIGFILVFGLIFFGAFAFTKYVKEARYRMKTMEEMAEVGEIK